MIKANTQQEFDEAIKKLRLNGGSIELGAGYFKIPKMLPNIFLIGSGRGKTIVKVEQ